MAVRAPDFRPDLDWINTGGRTFSLADFRGRVLLLDFWTYGCINCIHMIPELAEVVRRFPEEVVVVGVHSGKYVNERVSENIARACQRLGVHHPVLNDRQFRTWREYAVNAWPTLVEISPDGYVIGTRRGEVTADQLTPPLERAIEEARAKGTLLPRRSGWPRCSWPGTRRIPGETRSTAVTSASPWRRWRSRAPGIGIRSRAAGGATTAGFPRSQSSR